MLDLSKLKTAGVFIQINSIYLFMVGPNKDLSYNGIVRIGGHIEKDEEPEQTAIREAKEEAQVSVELIKADKTYYIADENSELIEIEWDKEYGQRPVLLSGGTINQPFSIMYIAKTQDTPKPDCETVCLCMIHQDYILDYEINSKKIEYTKLEISSAEKINMGLPLKAHIQYIALSKLLKNKDMNVGKVD